MIQSISSKYSKEKWQKIKAISKNLKYNLSISVYKNIEMKPYKFTQQESKQWNYKYLTRISSVNHLFWEAKLALFLLEILKKNKELIWSLVVTNKQLSVRYTISIFLYKANCHSSTYTFSLWGIVSLLVSFFVQKLKFRSFHGFLQVTK